VDAAVLAAIAAQGLDAQASLVNNDATTFFAAAGGLLHTGPTLTNVNDIRVLLVDAE
jgi:glycerate 2-kinase